MRPRDLRFSAIAALCTAALLGLLPGGAPVAQDSSLELRTRTIVAGAFCSCGCGNRLPGSVRDACFGCSVGKSEVSYIRRSLREGRSVQDLLLALGEPVTVSVFADYDDPGLPKAWRIAKRVAAEFQQHRVVVRTPGRSQAALRAVRFVECGREADRFAALRDAMIDHAGPWDVVTLRALAQRHGVMPAPLDACLARVEVGPQIEKDAQHARRARISSFPTHAVNGELVGGGESGLRAAIAAAIREGSI